MLESPSKSDGDEDSGENEAEQDEGENQPDEDPVELPRKKHYRQRAHANPISDHDFDYPRSPDLMDWKPFYGDFSHGKHVEMLDVGCGYGGLLMGLSRMFPETLILGFEIRVKVSDFVQDKIRALRLREPGQYRNVACIRTNAMKFLPNYFNRHQLSKMFFLFPDPHFKKSKHKWRIITPTLLAEYAFVLRPGGLLYTNTDVLELHVWMVKHLTEHPLFERLNEAETTADPVLSLIMESTEESKKVSRMKGEKFPAIFRRKSDPPWPDT